MHMARDECAWWFEDAQVVRAFAGGGAEQEGGSAPGGGGQQAVLQKGSLGKPLDAVWRDAASQLTGEDGGQYWEPKPVYCEMGQGVIKYVPCCAVVVICSGCSGVQ
jgi:hypothetical protein